MKIYAIIVSYNGKLWYDRCIGSLKSSNIPVNIVIVDNASSDDTAKYIYNRFPEVHLIESKENLGFAKANNVGIKYAYDHGADYVFLLNQDAWVENNTIGDLLTTFIENDNVGIASPIHLNGSYTALDHGFARCMNLSFISDSYLGKLKKYYQVQFVNAAAWMVSRTCIESVGGFDTSLFVHYGEDDNYCQRLRYHAFKLIVCSTCTICHDREIRKDNDNSRLQWNKIISQEELIEQWSDVNKEVFFDKEVRKYKIQLLKAMLMMNRKKIERCRLILSLLPIIEKSRMLNQKRQMNWL